MAATTREPETPSGRSLRKFRGVGHLHQSLLPHLEDSDLVGGAEAVLDGPQNSEGVSGIPLEIEYGVHHMFQDPGAGESPVLGDMADDEDRDAAPLGQGHELAGALPDLADATWGRFQRIGVHGLNGIHHHDPRLEPLYGGDDLFQ